MPLRTGYLAHFSPNIPATAMSTASTSPYDKEKFPGAAPSVSTEKWLNYIYRKLQKGYYLIIGEQRKIANFYRGYGEMEACSYPVAKKLLDRGELEPVGKHFLGTMYRLKSEAQPVPPPASTSVEDEEETDLALAEEAEELEEDLLEDLAEDVEDDEDILDEQT